MENSNTFATLLGLIVILWTIISRRTRHTYTSPAVLHNAAWAGGLLIVGSGLLRYAPISGYAWLLIVSSILCFNGGVAIAGVQSNRRPMNPTMIEKFLVTRGMYRILLLGFSVGLAVYLATIAKFFGLAALVFDPQSIRQYSAVSYLEEFPLYGKILFYLGPVCLILTVFPKFVQGLRKRPLALRLFIMLYLVGGMVATLQRTLLIVALIWIAGMLVLQLDRSHADGQRGKLNSKKVTAIIVAAFIGLTVFQGLALFVGKTGADNPLVSSVVDPRLRNNPLVSVLSYTSSGIPAFGKLTSSQNDDWPPALSRGPLFGDYNPQTWGAATLSAPLKLFPEAAHWQEIAPFVFLPLPTNVYTWLEPWYRDFRWPGVLFGSVIAGLIIGRFAHRRYRSPEAMLTASFLVGLSGLAAFANRLIAVVSLVIYATLWFLGAIRRSREASESESKGKVVLQNISDRVTD